MTSFPTQTINGILLIDKPSGISSNKALQIAKRALGAAKAGHTGSLDPLASGMLPLCFGEATKFSQVLLDADKHYHVVAKLGVRTDSADAEGNIIETRPFQPYNESQLSDVLANFQGELEQVPPMFSALKHQGQPLYKLARQGKSIERKARKVTIKALKLEAYTADTLTLAVTCSKGTYIRSLVEDIGLALGCGAHVIALRRTAVSHFQQEQMISLEELQRQDSAVLRGYLLPSWSMLRDWPNVDLSEAEATALRQGKIIMINTAFATGELLRLVDAQGEFIGIGEVTNENYLKVRRLLAIPSPDSKYCSDQTNA